MNGKSGLKTKMSKPIYAEDVNYWQTSRSSPDTWLDRAKKEVTRIGGKLIGEGFMGEPGCAAFMLAFEIEGEQFRMLWPVLQTKKGNVRAARIQSATALYREVKAACVKVKFLGARAAFFAYLVLPDGRTAVHIATPDLVTALPPMLAEPQ